MRPRQWPDRFFMTIVSLVQKRLMFCAFILPLFVVLSLLCWGLHIVLCLIELPRFGDLLFYGKNMPHAYLSPSNTLFRRLITCLLPLPPAINVAVINANSYWMPKYFKALPLLAEFFIDFLEPPLPPIIFHDMWYIQYLISVYIIIY